MMMMTTVCDYREIPTTGVPLESTGLFARALRRFVRYPTKWQFKWTISPETRNLKSGDDDNCV
jgi:hypothetical protein